MSAAARRGSIVAGAATVGIDLEFDIVRVAKMSALDALAKVTVKRRGNDGVWMMSPAVVDLGGGRFGFCGSDTVLLFGVPDFTPPSPVDRWAGVTDPFETLFFGAARNCSIPAGAFQDELAAMCGLTRDLVQDCIVVTEPPSEVSGRRIGREDWLKPLLAMTMLHDAADPIVAVEHLSAVLVTDRIQLKRGEFAMVTGIPPDDDVPSETHPRPRAFDACDVFLRAGWWHTKPSAAEKEARRAELEVMLRGCAASAERCETASKMLRLWVASMKHVIAEYNTTQNQARGTVERASQVVEQHRGPPRVIAGRVYGLSLAQKVAKFHAARRQLAIREKYCDDNNHDAHWRGLKTLQRDAAVFALDLENQEAEARRWRTGVPAECRRLARRIPKSRGAKRDRLWANIVTANDRRALGTHIRRIAAANNPEKPDKVLMALAGKLVDSRIDRRFSARKALQFYWGHIKDHTAKWRRADGSSSAVELHFSLGPVMTFVEDLRQPLKLKLTRGVKRWIRHCVLAEEDMEAWTASRYLLNSLGGLLSESKAFTAVTRKAAETGVLDYERAHPHEPAGLAASDEAALFLMRCDAGAQAVVQRAVARREKWLAKHRPVAHMASDNLEHARNMVRTELMTLLLPM